MIKLYSECIGSKIFSFRDGELLGVLQDIIVDPNNGRIAGLLVLVKISSGIKKMAIIDVDILEWRNQIVVQDEDSFAEINEVVRLQKILDEKVFILNQPVYTISGEYIGHVRNYFIDVNNLIMIKILIRKTEWLFFCRTERIVTSDKIIKIEKDRIIIEDNYAKKKVLIKDKIPCSNAVPA